MSICQTILSIMYAIHVFYLVWFSELWNTLFYKSKSALFLLASSTQVIRSPKHTIFTTEGTAVYPKFLPEQNLLFQLKGPFKTANENPALAGTYNQIIYIDQLMDWWNCAWKGLKSIDPIQEVVKLEICKERNTNRSNPRSGEA